MSKVAERLLSAALVSSHPPAPAMPNNPVDLANEIPATRAERDRRILELHRQGVSGREFARRLGIGETTVRKVLKRDKSQ
jgi:DNA-binding NarL/FixJ family response regulator